MDYATLPLEEAASQGMAIASHASARPDDIAVRDMLGKRLTWQELNAAANQLANLLHDHGLVPDDGVALLCSNRVEFAIVVAATQRTGTRFTPINWHLTGEEVSYIVDNCDAKIFIAEDRYKPAAEYAASENPDLAARLSIGGELSQFKDLLQAISGYDGRDITEPVRGGGMLYTSGTTGRPKGVYVSNRPPTMPAPQRDLGESSVTLCLGPAYHAAPLAIDVLLTMVSGGELIFMDRFEPEYALQLINKHRVTHCHMVATMFHRLLQLDQEIKDQYDISTLKLIIHGAAPCPVHVKKAMIDWVGPILLEYYAATEGGGGFLIGSEEWLKKPGSVGCPGPEFDNKILDDEDNEVPQGEVGTIYMRAPEAGRFQYYKDEDKTSSSYRGDYFTLGDMGYFDKDGYLFLTGRTAELIISGGVNIYPQEVDSVIMQHPAVHEVCTIGAPNDEWGEEVKSVVQLADGVTASQDLIDDLLTFTRERIAGYKCPRTIDFADDLPRLPTGKIQRRLVRDPYWAGRDKSI